MVNLAYHGEKQNRYILIKRMQNHIKRDELVKMNYVAESPFSGAWRGCAVSCIARDNLEDVAALKDKNIDMGKQVNVGKVYEEVEKLINIPFIAPLIDTCHEWSPINEGFSLGFLISLDLTTDYSSLVKDFLEYYIERPLSKDELKSLYEEKGSELLYVVQKILRHTISHRPDEIGKTFICYIESYNPVKENTSHE